MVAGVFTPHSFQVGSTDGAVSFEHAIQLSEVGHHDFSSVRIAAQFIFSRVKGTSTLQVAPTYIIHYLGRETSDSCVWIIGVVEQRVSDVGTI